MKQFITLVATAVIAAATFQVHADGDNKMVIVTDGSSTPVSVADITKITFDGMTMTVSTPDGDAQTDLTQVNSPRASPPKALPSPGVRQPPLPPSAPKATPSPNSTSSTANSLQATTARHRTAPCAPTYLSTAEAPNRRATAS